MIPLGVLASSYVAPAGGPAAFDYVGYTGTTGTTTGVTFSGVDLGPAASDRVIVAGIFVGTLRVPTSVTIGGVSATIDIVRESGMRQVAIARASVPNGTTGDVVCSWGYYGTTPPCGLVVYRSAGYTVSVSDTGNEAFYDATGSTVLTPTASGGVAVGVVGCLNSTAISWSGATEDTDQGVWGAAHGDTDGSDLTITATTSVNGNPGAFAAVAYSLT